MKKQVKNPVGGGKNYVAPHLQVLNIPVESQCICTSVGFGDEFDEKDQFYWGN